jgi:hypothetical protein
MDFQSGLQLAGGVVELAKNVKELSEKESSLELKEAAVELRSKTIDLKETVNDMRDRIIELEKRLEFKEQLGWNTKTFEYEQNGKKIYVCNGCHANGKITHMSETRHTAGYHAADCPVCKNKVVFANSAIQKMPRTSGGW